MDQMLPLRQKMIAYQRIKGLVLFFFIAKNTEVTPTGVYSCELRYDSYIKLGKYMHVYIGQRYGKH